MNDYQHASILLFDGVCNLCNRSVQFVLKHEKQNKILFASQQSKIGQQLLAKFGMSANNINSFVFIENNQIYLQATAAFKVAKHLSFPFSLLQYLAIIPSSISNGVYQIIAKNRYKWFGKKEQCWIPNQQLQHRFLEYHS